MTENRKIRSMSALNAIPKSRRLKALKGDVPQTALLIGLMEVYQVAAEPEPTREIQIRFTKPDPARVNRMERGERFCIYARIPEGHRTKLGLRPQSWIYSDWLETVELEL